MRYSFGIPDNTILSGMPKQLKIEGFDVFNNDNEIILWFKSLFKNPSQDI